MAAGAIGMWLPTSTTFQQLEHAGSVEAVRARAPGRLGSVVVEDINADVVRIEMPAGGGVAGQPVYAYLVGRERCVLVDPGDPTGPALDVAIGAPRSGAGAIEAVAVTHVDADHAAGAEALAEILGIPVLASPIRAATCHTRCDRWQMATSSTPAMCALRVVSTPGPTPDHLALVVGKGEIVLSAAISTAVAAPGPSPARPIRRLGPGPPSGCVPWRLVPGGSAAIRPLTPTDQLTSRRRAVHPARVTSPELYEPADAPEPVAQWAEARPPHLPDRITALPCRSGRSSASSPSPWSMSGPHGRAWPISRRASRPSFS